MSKTAPIPILDRTHKNVWERPSSGAVTAIAKAHSCSYGTDSQSGVGNHYLDFSPTRCYNQPMSKQYRVKWCETVEYYTDIWASDEDQALDTFLYLREQYLDNKIPIEESGWRNMERATIQVKEQ